MEIREFNYLLEIEKTGSISLAAENLYISQSALSQFLKNYENDLNIKLFYRTPYGVKPIFEGGRFLEAIRNVYEEFLKLQNNILTADIFSSGRRISEPLLSFRIFSICSIGNTHGLISRS